MSKRLFVGLFVLAFGGSAIADEYAPVPTGTRRYQLVIDPVTNRAGLRNPDTGKFVAVQRNDEWYTGDKTDAVFATVPASKDTPLDKVIDPRTGRKGLRHPVTRKFIAVE